MRKGRNSMKKEKPTANVRWPGEGEKRVGEGGRKRGATFSTGLEGARPTRVVPGGKKKKRKLL